MKTIFLLLPTGITVRNFLTTGVIEQLLLKDNIRILVFTFAPKTFTQYLNESKKFKVMKLDKCRTFTFSNFLHIILKRRFYKINQTLSTNLLSKSPIFPEGHSHFLEFILSQPFPKSKKIYTFLRSLVESLNGFSSQIKEYFDYYKPSLVISTHPIAKNETEFLQCAKKLGVNTIGMIKSWDNLTTKGYLPVYTNHYIVWNEVMQKEMIRMHKVSNSKITITGVPQFDSYADHIRVVKRDNFFHKLGLDSKKKTVFYATNAKTIAPEDPKIIIKIVKRFSEENRGNIQFIIRLHPLDNMQRYKNIQKFALSNLVFQVPGGRIDGDANYRMQDPMFINELRDTLFHSDVVINTCSSISLDATAMNKPVINIGFDLEQKEYLFSIKRYYDFNHFKPVVETGATKLALCFNELIHFILRYLNNPELENEERAQLRHNMCYKVDGQSSKRIADTFIRQLD